MNYPNYLFIINKQNKKYFPCLAAFPLSRVACAAAHTVQLRGNTSVLLLVQFKLMC